MLDNPNEMVSDGLKATVFTPESISDNGQEVILNTYLLLNAAASPDIAICLEGFSPIYRSLFDVSVLDDLGHVAPYLVQVDISSDVLDWWLAEGYMKQWGIIIRSPLSVIPLTRHLKKFTKITNAGRTYFFRFYQPTTFNHFIPNLTQEQLAEFFSPLYAVYAETTDEPEQLMHYVYAGNQLKIVKLALPMATQPEGISKHVAI